MRRFFYVNINDNTFWEAVKREKIKSESKISLPETLIMF